MKPDFSALKGIEIRTDSLSQVLYATDASIYRELPLGVAFPRSTEEVQQLVRFAERQKVPLIPRAAGTSLAGQCVGKGLVVDVSRYMNRLLELNVEERWVRVEPGMVRDELNRLLHPHGLWFGPNTSTSNRCTLGGMVGNNSCGSTSIFCGSTRDHLLEAEVVLSSGERTTFKALNQQAFAKYRSKQGLEGKIYRHLHQLLSRAEVRREIKARYPKQSIHRRNTGYALDLLANAEPYNPQGAPLNLAQLLCGSEGTLAFITALKLHLLPLPPEKEILLLPHFNSLDEALQAVKIIVQHRPYACELMDKPLLDCTRESRAQQKNRFFLQGDPQALLMVECRGETQEEAERQASGIVNALKKMGMGYAFPVAKGNEIDGVWALRKAGLGVLANLPGRARAIACVEDTAVDVRDLPNYIRDFSRLMARFGQRAIYYAHAGAGELHIRPILDLYDPKDFKALRQICEASARLVAQYRGSLSGEHGDGRLRAEFIPVVLGAKITTWLEEIKSTWDPHRIFNPGKIVQPPAMDENLRAHPNSPQPPLESLLDFSDKGGLLGAVRRCTGSGDCRKSHRFSGNMCPSFQATREEKHSTRGRANALREFLESSSKHPFDHEELKEVLDLCLSCKACTAECPSGVNMTALKAEFLYQYYQRHARPLRDRLFIGIELFLGISARFSGLPQLFLNTIVGTWIRRIMGLSPKRKLPVPKRNHFFNRYARREKRAKAWRGEIVLFVDPFTNYFEPDVAWAAMRLFEGLGYEVHCPERPGSGRPLLSKGFLQKARLRAEEQVRFFSEIVREGAVLIGLEPSELLSFRDEYPVLVRPHFRKRANELAQRSFLAEEFLARELRQGRLAAEELILNPYLAENKTPLAVHIHCHQKALGRAEDLRLVLATASANCPAHPPVHLLDTGCCGMAGAFGYEKEHYDISMKIGELRLFPTLRALPKGAALIATGHSCRQQIADMANLKSMHVIEALQANLTA